MTRDDTMRCRTATGLTILLVSLLAAAPAAAQPMEGDTYRQESSVMSNGAHHSSGATYTNRGTLAQPTPIGVSDSAALLNEPGFWHAEQAAAGDDDTGDDDTGDDDTGDDDTGTDDDAGDDDTGVGDDDTGAGDDDDSSGRDVTCKCKNSVAGNRDAAPATTVALLAALAIAVAVRRRA